MKRSPRLRAILTGIMVPALWLLGPGRALAVIPGPYAPDGATLHLWHLDEAGTPCLDAITSGGTQLTSLSASSSSVSFRSSRPPTR